MSEHHTCVAKVPIFQGLTAEEQAEVAGFARPVSAAPNEQIVAAGSSRRRLMVVHSGRVRIVHLLPNGTEHVVRVLGEGDAIGEEAFVLGRRPSHYAYADTEAQLCTFDHKDLARLISRYPAIALRMLQVQSARLSDAEQRLAAMGGSGGADVGSRLAVYLLDLPSKARDDGIEVELSMAKKDVASFLGTSPETLSRRLRQWTDDGIVQPVGRRGILILDVDALATLAGG